MGGASPPSYGHGNRDGPFYQVHGGDGVVDDFLHPGGGQQVADFLAQGDGAARGCGKGMGVDSITVGTAS